MKKGYLILANGMVFEGERFGADRDSIGELVFTTGMVGYLETLTDPSYAGQIIMQTFPLIGNYGVIEQDFEGACAALGYIVHEKCDFPSNFRSQYALDRFLKDRNIPGLSGIETRDVTRILRNAGTMNAMIASEVPKDLSAICTYCIKDSVASVSTRKAVFLPAKGAPKYKVALIDYGAKRNIARALAARGCAVSVYPFDAKAAEILATDPDGIMLTNGPGDPADNGAAIAELQKLIGKKPVFGICLGHQLLALAMGAKTGKLPFGHRGANQPVKDLVTGRTYITSQNHGYAVLPETLEGVGVLRYVNANDGTCEGVDYPDKAAFTVQFHPEACGGPEDTEFLFDRFISLMEGK